MHTARNLGIILAGIAIGALTVVAGLVVVLGVVPGLVVAAALAAVGLARYGLALRPWHRRWGATDAEAHGPLPGDDLVPDGSATTRAVAIAAPPEDVWPWLVQLGWGRAGWYISDWIDDDGRPRVDSIVPDWQDLDVGDRILVTPDRGFVVHLLDPPHTLVAVTDDGSTSWCLRVEPDGAGSRLVSRFRAHPHVTPASLLWWVVADPGLFVMERTMLRGIAARAEARHAAASSDATADRGRGTTSTSSPVPAR